MPSPRMPINHPRGPSRAAPETLGIRIDNLQSLVTKGAKKHKVLISISTQVFLVGFHV